MNKVQNKNKKVKLIVFLGLILSLTLALTFALASNRFAVNAVAYAGQSYEEEIGGEYFEGKFSDDRVIVVLTKDATRQFLDYTPLHFADVNAIAVEDLTASTIDWVRKQILGIPTQERMMINPERFRRILSVVLFENCQDNVLHAISILEQRYDIESATPNYIMQIASVTANDTRRSEQWGLNIIQANLAWGLSTGSNSTVKVGVLDSGIDGGHEDLTNRIHRGNPHNIDTTLHRDFTTGAILGNRIVNPVDYTSGAAAGHGTHVAGIIGAQGNNNMGIAGVAWDIRLVSLRVATQAGGVPAEWVANAINFAASVNIPILNGSFGWTGRDRGGVRNAIEAYEGLFVASAGNNGSDNDRNPNFPASYDLDNIISVGATDSSDRRSDWNGFGNLWGLLGQASSSFGANSVHIFAPGTNVLSTFPGNQYRSMSGTSMAAPHVAGVAALLLAYNTALTTAELRAAILENSNSITISTPGAGCSGGNTQTVRRLNAYMALSSVFRGLFINNGVVTGFRPPANCNGTVNIPEGITAIGAGAFANQQNLSTITLPSTVRYIGDNAFRNTPNMVEVSFGEGSELRSIVGSAFWHSGIREIVLPEGVESIGGSAFMGAISLERVVTGARPLIFKE